MSSILEKERNKGKKRSQGSEEKQKVVSVESIQEEKYMPKNVGCRMRMLVGYDMEGKINATIITTKEEVDYQFWYPKRNKVIKEYKNIKDYYSWNDEFENESEFAKRTNSPRVYNLRTPQKKCRIIDVKLDTTSDDESFTDKSVDLKPAKPTAPSTLASIPSSKPIVSSKIMGSSIVDQILLEESLRANQPISGSVIQLQQPKT